MKLFTLLNRIIISAAVLLVLTLNHGCTRKDHIISTDTTPTGPNLEIRLEPLGDAPIPGGPIQAVVRVSENQSPLDKLIYAISGEITKADSIILSPTSSEWSGVIPIPDDIGLSEDSSVVIKITAYDASGGETSVIDQFFPLDVKPPDIEISCVNPHRFTAGDTLILHVAASDNIALHHIIFSIGGAFTRYDTLIFQTPYPSAIDTQMAVPISDTAYMSPEFWVSAEALDVNFNSRIVTLDQNFTLVDYSGPVLDVHPVDGDMWVQRGDSLRFWVVGRDNSPLQCLGYELYYGHDEYWYTIQLRDSILGDFAAVDSIYCAYLVPEEMYCENFVIIKEFGRDIYGNLTSNTAYETTHGFTVEDRIRFSQAKTFEVSYPDIYSLMLVDDRRERVYLLSSEQNRINVYSQTSQEFLAPIDLPSKPSWYCLSPDTNAILITSEIDRSVSVIDLENSPGHVDTSIALPGKPQRIVSMADGTALILTYFDNNMSSMLRLNLSNYYLDSLPLGYNYLTDVSTSGNSEYALISTYSNSQSHLFLYRANTGITAVQTINWRVWRIAGNYDGSRFFIGGSDMNHNGVFDNNLTLIDSIPQSPCQYFFESGAFSRDGRDLFLGSLAGTIGIADGEYPTVEGNYYTAWLDNERPYIIIALATNATGDRLFFTGQQDGMNFVFWDIPVDPR